MSAATNRSSGARSPCRERAVVRTVAPAARNCDATAAPIPLVPPVTPARAPPRAAHADLSRGRALLGCARRGAAGAAPESRGGGGGGRGEMHEPRARLEESGETMFLGSSRVMLTALYDVFEDFRK